MKMLLTLLRQNVRRLKRLSLGFITAILLGCTTSPQAADNTDAPMQIEHSRDRFERFNRGVYSFNMFADKWLLKPVTKGYVAITPDPVESGVSNFFDNLSELNNIVNDVLQWKWKQAGNDAGRLLINSTVGVAGLFDVARKAGLSEADGEDFGQTLAVWGVPEGPYLVLPLLGPYTVTEAVGLPVNWQIHPVSNIGHRTTRYSLVALDFIDIRAKLLQTEELISGDEYTFIRDAYLQRREYLVKDGNVEDDFGGEFDEQEFDF
ncbi:MlaA family lipoprotein [Teredinibacter franksiae]|uniref:MlaA family lipoprotein n=1 Tax=Teredinibacter franksiae TaxID=2761453 RepID=UPI001627C0DC|nr:VacJ family lipoprotein [Teredinibacter franksiae]